jgi:hypothetical protein
MPNFKALDFMHQNHDSQSHKAINRELFYKKAMSLSHCETRQTPEKAILPDERALVGPLNLAINARPCAPGGQL